MRYNIVVIVNIILMSVLHFGVTNAQTVYDGNLAPDLLRDFECAAPEVNSITICENTSVMLDANAAAESINWYELTNKGWECTSHGLSFQTPYLNKTVHYKVQAVCPYFPNQLNTLTTQWNGENGKEGIMFNVSAETNLSLYAIDFHMEEVLTKCNVFVLKGDYSSYINQPGKWELVYSKSIKGLGKYNRTHIDLDEIKMEADKNYGIYISLEDANVMYYSSGESEFSDENMTISDGKGVSWPFAYVCGSREFNGSLHYVVGNKPVSEMIDVEVNVETQPSLPVMYFKGNHFETGLDGSYVWYFGGEQIVSTSSSKYFPKESGYYSVAKNNGGCLSEKSNEQFYELSSVDAAVEIYPIPSSETVNIEFANNPEFYVHVKIVNLRGQVVFQDSYSPNKDISISVRNFKNGRYLLDWTCGSQSGNTIMVKN
jgi:hypothetical protein